MSKLDYSGWYLVFDSMKDLNKRQYNDVMEMYRSMLHAADDSRHCLAESYLLTLKNGGFIKNSTQEERETKISELVDENI
jgi:peptide methionine sulfoxide reductase MsrA